MSIMTRPTDDAPASWEGNVEDLRGLVSDRALTGETLLLNMGPHHPSTHGVLRVLLELDGEEIVTCLPDVGYLHTGIEKNIESKTYEKGITLTDRMDYLAAMNMNLGWALTVEKLLQHQISEKARHLRVIISEMNRTPMPLGQAASHSRWLVQPPKPAWSCASTICRVRR